ncbi:MAG: hypothetical protein HDR89_09620 [Bacteroides sp.]|nr:hypothetical protein [Bacteroides sp.]
MKTQRVTTMSASEMLDLWKLLGGYESLNVGVKVTNLADEGVDLDRLLMRRIEGWYATQLLTAPAEVLPVYDIADDVDIYPAPADGSATVVLPEGTVRLFSVMMAGWQRPAIIINDRRHPLALAQSNPFTRATASAPLAIHDPSGVLSLYPATPGEPTLLSLPAIIQPRRDIYLMTDALVDRIPRLEP